MVLPAAAAPLSASETAVEPRAGSLALAVSAAAKAAVVAGSGLMLSCGLGLVVWAVTPSSGAGPGALLRAGAAAFSAANGMAVTIGRSTLTLTPLMLTIIAAALLATVSGRGRVVPHGRRQESVAVGAAAAAYGLVVTVVGVMFGGSGVVRTDQWWRPVALALVIVGCSTLVRGDGWRSFLTARLPIWVPTAVRLAAVAVSTMLGGGAVAVAIGLVRSVGTSAAVQNLAAPGAAGGLGMTILGLAFLPNAVMAGVGYNAGVGFTIGAGTYSPFGSSPVGLPPMTLLAAAPTGHDVARPTLLLFLFPVLAAALIGIGAVARLERRRDRLRAVVAAAAVAAIALATMSVAAAGGVAGGEWSSTGVPPVLLAVVLTGVLGAVAAAVVALSPVRMQTEMRSDLSVDASAPAADAVPAAPETAADADPVIDSDTDLDDGGPEPASVAEVPVVAEPASVAEVPANPEPAVVAEPVVLAEPAVVAELAVVAEPAAVTEPVVVAEPAAADPAGENRSPPSDDVAAQCSTDTEAAAQREVAGTVQTEPTATGRDRREEDVNVESEADTDAQLFDRLHPRNAGRRAG